METTIMGFIIRVYREDVAYHKGEAKKLRMQDCRLA